MGRSITTVFSLFLFFTATVIDVVVVVNGQLYSASDRSPQELALLDWTSGVRMAYCQDMPLLELIEPFREAMTKMVNRHCRNTTACSIQKPVTFTIHHVILLDGYPKRDNRAVVFRFFIILPPDALPLEKQIAKPLLTRKILADVLRVQITELTQRLKWQIITVDKYPRFDPITTFMNRALIPIGVVAGIFMLFLAYWSATISSSSHSSEGWMVSGSTGGKNAALRRTLEIIDEQKYQLEQERRLKLAIQRRQLLSRSVLIDPNLPANPPEAPKRDFGVSFDSTGSLADTIDDIPEIVIVHTRDSSRDTVDSPIRKYSHPSRGKGRRFSSVDDHKRKKSVFGGPSTHNNKPDRQKKWKTGSLMFSSFSKDGNK